MLGPMTRTLYLRASASSSSCISFSPTSAKPEGIITAPGMPFSPTSVMAAAQNLAGTAKIATSTSPGMSFTLL